MSTVAPILQWVGAFLLMGVVGWFVIFCALWFIAAAGDAWRGGEEPR